MIHKTCKRMTKAAMAAARDGGTAEDATERLARRGAFVTCAVSKGGRPEAAAVGLSGASFGDGRTYRVYRAGADHFLMSDDGQSYPPASVEVLAVE